MHYATRNACRRTSSSSSRGRPVVVALEPRRLFASVSGSVFVDANFNGRRDSAEVGVAGQTVFADYDYDGVVDAGEPAATTQSDGGYALTVAVRSFALRLKATSGYGQVSPADNGAQFYAPSGAGVYGTGSTFGVSAGVAPLPLPLPVPIPSPAPTLARVRADAFADANRNGQHDAGEAARSGITVYVDLNYNGVLDANEPSGLAGSTADFTLAPGGYSLRARDASGRAVALAYGVQSIWVNAKRPIDYVAGFAIVS